MRSEKKIKGFTLIEIVVVTAILSILFSIVITAINPIKQFGDAKNTQRKNDVNAILNAVSQYEADNKGIPPSSIPSSSVCNLATNEICKQGANCENLVDLSILVLVQKYLTKIPHDPTGSSFNGTGYFIFKNSNNRITVCAPYADNNAVISVTR